MKKTMGIVLLLILLIAGAMMVSKLPTLAFIDQKIDEDEDEKGKEYPKAKDGKVKLTEDQWKELLSEEEYYVLRQAGTERPFSGKYDKHYEKGSYLCAGCGTVLFESATKYNSGCGWPAFYDVADKETITLKRDTSHGMIRTEVLCANCGGHLGHVFEDGPRPTRLRYCINSVSMDFIPAGEPLPEPKTEQIKEGK